MISIARVILLAGCFALSSVPCGLRAQSSQDSCSAISDALEAIGKVKPGDLRTKLEQDFKRDGGLTFPKTERYVYKKYPLIKIDVEFSLKKGNTWPQHSSEDTLTSISKPYLEYPFYD
jgi:hypothetical protein